MCRDSVVRCVVMGPVVAGLLVASPAAASTTVAEALTDYAGHVADAREVTVTSTTGQRLRIGAYGDDILRVRAVRAGEAFLPDTRYGMLAPDAGSRLGGSLSVVDRADSLTVATPARNGIRAVVRKRPLRLEFSDPGRNAPLAKEGAADGIAWGGTNHSVVMERFAGPVAGERFLKAGHGYFGRSPRLDRTGDIVSHNYGTETAGRQQAPAIVPFYLSSRGYGVFFNTTFDTTFNFGNGGSYAFWADAHEAGGSRPQLDYFVIDGPRFVDVIDRYTQLTGRPRLPQQSIFGLQLSDKNFPSVSSAEWWKQKITAHRQAGFPLDHQVNDNRWREGSGGWSGSWFEFSSERWPDPAAYREWADYHGVTVTLDYNRNNSSEMAGWRPGPPPGYSFGASDLANVSENDAVPDWSNPAARAWVWDVFWTKALDPALRFPGDGLWLDESDELGPIPYDADAANGWKWAELRNAYFLRLLEGVGRDGWDGDVGESKRPWIWTRGATAGQQRHGHYWTGDIESTYDEMRMQIRGMQAAGLGGFPYANIDGGGFHGGPGDGLISDAVYRNWPAAWSSFSPIWRPHSGADTAALGPRASRWPLEQSAAAQADFEKYGILRYSLMPYIYTLAHEASAKGTPMARAMAIDYQDRGNAYAHDLQYLWGPSMLVAPATNDGGGVQDIWLPAGDTWYDFWTDTRRAGSDSSDAAYATRTGELPLFVKAGAILPRYPYAQSTAFADKRRLELDVYAGKDGEFALYEDDGVTERFRTHGERSITRLRYLDGPRRVVIEHPGGTYAGATAKRQYVVRIHGLRRPAGMRVNGGATLPAFTSEAAALRNGAGSAWDAGSRVLSVVTAPIPVVTAGGIAATIEPSGAAFPPVQGGAVYEAEDGGRSGAFIDTRHPDFTGTSYVDFADASHTGAYVEWRLDVPEAGMRTISFRYANGGASDRPLAISVDGIVVDGRLSFPPTGGWRTWGTATMRANLPASSSVAVRATTTGANGPNLDGIEVG